MSIKNDQRGTAFLVVLLVVAAAIVVGGVMYGFLAVRDANKPAANTNTFTTTNGNVNATSNTNSANTNVATNTSSASNTNAAVNTNGAANTNATGNTNAAVNTNESAENSLLPTIGWKTYTNATYHFSFLYPADWTIKEDSSSAPFHVTASHPTNAASQGVFTVLARFPFSTAGLGGNDNAVQTSKKVSVGDASASEYAWIDKLNGKALGLYIIFDELPKDWPDDDRESKSNYERYIDINPGSNGSYQTHRTILSTFTFTQ